MRSLEISILTALYLVAPVAAPAEVRDASRAGFTSENVATVPVDATAAWTAVVDEVGLWWLADHTWWGDAAKLSIEPRAGGCFCEIDGERQARHMTVVFVDPGKTLRMTGGLGPLQGMGLDGVLEWQLAAGEDGGTQVTLLYRVGGYTPDGLEVLAPAVDGVLAAQLRSLAAHLAGPAEAADDAAPPSP